jgi:hydrogenase expression/formation protein HypD
MFEYRDKHFMQKIIQILSDSNLKLRFMHVCGTHQDTIVKYGLDNILQECSIEVRQGPGCPVCITTNPEIEKGIILAKNGITITSFGDMLRVPTSMGSLMDMRTEGCDVRIVYSVEDAVSLAYKNPKKKFIFMAIGFETTAPGTAAILMEGKLPNNFSIISCHRYLPPALSALLEMGESKIDGIMEPGHVSTIIGLRPYEEINNVYKIPQVVAGFEPLDVMMAIYMLVKQKLNNETKVENEYSRSVKPEGNKRALNFIKKVFEPTNAYWRGFPIIPNSKMKLKKEYDNYNAEVIFADLLEKEAQKKRFEFDGCRCNEVLRGLVEPKQCPLFGKSCTPQNPVGPCMVSYEGSCNIEYKYRRIS